MSINFCNCAFKNTQDCVTDSQLHFMTGDAWLQLKGYARLHKFTQCTTHNTGILRIFM